MLKIDRSGVGFPEELTPFGDDGFDREPFSEWWTRHGSRFPNLDPRVVEQWIFRHNTLSEFCGLDFFSLKSRLEVWGTERILREIFCEDGLDAESDYRVFNINRPSATARPFAANGTWDYPIVVLETPNGFYDHRARHPDVRYLLIEGHKRRRYLNAMLARGEANAEHEIFILSQIER
ncbi:protein of unknown function [Methylorubrum extorquens]|uniref:Uncharacterized protein n=1 Tax=Methylorubrum extorquens TaxID=408 RepID=A0A2N9ASJ2_METEX|nr:protein of unknown function [Methylorubrum extorquens]